MKKNILGMDMTEWKHLSGLADPYRLALAEAGVEAGVPPIVESKPINEDDDDSGVPREIQVAQAAAGKKQRLDSIKRAARNLRGKTRNAAEKAASTPASDRYKAHLELMKHRKTFVKGESVEGFDPDLLWAAFLESRGTSAEEFGKLLDIAIENDDEEMAIELLAIEDQLDELLGAMPAKPKNPMVNGAQAAGNMAASSAMGAVTKPPVAPAAGGGAPAGATPPAGAPPAAPAGAAPQAAAAAPASAAVPAAAPASASPAGAPKKMGLLGTLGRGIAKAGAGAAGMMKSMLPKPPMAT